MRYQNIYNSNAKRYIINHFCNGGGAFALRFAGA